METPRVRLGELLVRSGLLTQQQLDEALSLQKKDGRRLGTLLVETGLVTETQVTQVLSQQLSVPWVSLHHIDFSRQLLNLVPDEVAERYCLIPIYVRRVRGLGEALYVAMDDPTNADALEEVAAYSGLHVRAMIAPPSDIRSAMAAYYGRGSALQQAAVPAENAGRVVATATGSEQKPEKRPEQPNASTPESAARSEPSVPAAVPQHELERSQPRDQEQGAPKDATDSVRREDNAPPSSRNQVSARGPGMPQPKGGTGARLISLTLLDGTTINLPARPPNSEPTVPSGESSEDRFTARDLVAALRAAAHGADATEILGEEPRWESMFAALLSLLLKKHLIADWEFIEEYRKG